MNSKEVFKREMHKAGFDVEIDHNQRPFVKVSNRELDDLLKIASVECEVKKFPKFSLVYPK